jgi:hypothetical protein
MLGKENRMKTIGETTESKNYYLRFIADSYKTGDKIKRL